MWILRYLKNNIIHIIVISEELKNQILKVVNMCKNILDLLRRIGAISDNLINIDDTSR